MPLPPSAACRFFESPPVNLQNLPLHLTKNSFASAPNSFVRYCPKRKKRSLLINTPLSPAQSAWSAVFSCKLQKTALPQNAAGHGGSVSRRDHKQAYQRHAHFSGGTAPTEIPNSNASRSSGERGLGGEALLSEKRPLPRSSQPYRLFERGCGGERFSIEKRSPRKSHLPISFIFSLAIWRAARARISARSPSTFLGG